MPITGLVANVNTNTGKIAAQTPRDELTVFELLGDYSIKVGDIITGELEKLGGATLYNETQQLPMNVFVQGVKRSIHSAQTLMTRP